ncbi:MAG TPA: hypothetical protein VLT91_11245 [Rhizomicrobium sp.]|nr:hypothetical protein [Rhizomicrobium sp.]
MTKRFASFVLMSALFAVPQGAMAMCAPTDKHDACLVGSWHQTAGSRAVGLHETYMNSGSDVDAITFAEDGTYTTASKAGRWSTAGSYLSMCQTDETVPVTPHGRVFTPGMGTSSPKTASFRCTEKTLQIGTKSYTR